MQRRTDRNKVTRTRLLSWLTTGLGIFWAFPVTLFGLLLTVPILLRNGKLCIVHAPTPALLVSGPLADLMLARHPFGAMCAMAIGHIVIADRAALTPRILVHELEHVRQATRWGIVFPFAYVASSGWAALRGQDAYWYNVFEIDARKAERHA